MGFYSVKYYFVDGVMVSYNDFVDNLVNIAGGNNVVNNTDYPHILIPQFTYWWDYLFTRSYGRRARAVLLLCMQDPDLRFEVLNYRIDGKLHDLVLSGDLTMWFYERIGVILELN